MSEEINKKILDLLWTSVKFESGDGDAIWLSKHTSLSDLASFLGAYDAENKTGWDIRVPDEKHILWGNGEEWVIITDDKEFYESQPSWITLRINY